MSGILRRVARRVTRILDARFTPAHRGGDGPPLVLVHGFMDTWRVRELVLPRLERHHTCWPPRSPGTPAGHRSRPAGLDWTATRSPTRSSRRWTRPATRPRTWPAGDTSYRETLALQARLHAGVRATAPLAAALMDDPGRRRAATQLITVRWEHLPAELLAHQAIGIARCDAEPMLAYAAAPGYDLDAERITCPVRLVSGTGDRLLPWPQTARRFTHEWLPQADVVLLDDVGHCPQLDVPLEARGAPPGPDS